MGVWPDRLEADSPSPLLKACWKTGGWLLSTGAGRGGGAAAAGARNELSGWTANLISVGRPGPSSESLVFLLRGTGSALGSLGLRARLGLGSAGASGGGFLGLRPCENGQSRDQGLYNPL